MKFTIAENLKDFLEEKDLLEQFSKNAAAESLQSSFLRDISSAFVWRDSPEGHSFWSPISKKFETKINSNETRTH